MTQRTLPQNSALHKYFELLADALNDAGYDMKAVLEKKEVDVPWDGEMVKRVLWKGIQIAKFDKESTTKLETDEVNKVYEILDRHISSHFGVHVEFPSYEEQLNKSLIK